MITERPSGIPSPIALVSARVKMRQAVSEISPAIAAATGTPPDTSRAAKGRALTGAADGAAWPPSMGAADAVWQADSTTMAGTWPASSKTPSSCSAVT